MEEDDTMIFGQMQNMNMIVEYVQSLGFELQKCSDPLNNFEARKVNLYFYLKNKMLINNSLFKIFYTKLFNTLVTYFPIKFKEEREDKSVWFCFRDENKNIVYELEIKPHSNLSKFKNNFFHYNNFNFSLYYITMYCGDNSPVINLYNKFFGKTPIITECVGSITVAKVEEYLSRYGFKDKIRENKLERLLYEC